MNSNLITNGGFVKEGIWLPPAKQQVGDRLDKLCGFWSLEHLRKGKVIHRQAAWNLITNEGKNKLLGVMFNAATQLTPWYIGLIDNAAYSTVAATDTYDGINDTNGWDEFASYTDPGNGDSAVTRPEWTEDAPASQSITNSSVVTFDITGPGTVKGLFLVAGTNAQTKSDSTASGNFLWCATLFTGGDRIVAISDALKVTYTANA